MAEVTLAGVFLRYAAVGLITGGLGLAANWRRNKNNSQEEFKEMVISTEKYEDMMQQDSDLKEIYEEMSEGLEALAEKTSLTAKGLLEKFAEGKITSYKTKTEIEKLVYMFYSKGFLVLSFKYLTQIQENKKLSEKCSEYKEKYRTAKSRVEYFEKNSEKTMKKLEKKTSKLESLKNTISKFVLFMRFLTDVF